MAKTAGVFLLSAFLLCTGCGLSNNIYIPSSLKGEDKKNLFILQGCGRAAKVNGEGPTKGVFVNFVLEPNKKHTLTFPKPNSGNPQDPPSKVEIMGKPGEVKSCQDVILNR